MPDLFAVAPDRLLDLLAALLVAGAAAGYLLAAAAVRRRGWWPPARTACWYAGLTAVAATRWGPLAAAAHHDFTAHMATHLLLGMAAPLLLVLSAPLTLALRALPVARARTLSRLLRSPPVRFLSHPVTAAVLDAGGLWLLYTTDLYPAMRAHPWLHTLVQIHVLAAGYLFTAATIGVDPAPHRPGRTLRAAVLVAFLASHGILAKHLYAHPSAGVPAPQAGAQLMYYGGDVVHLALIIVFCLQWYTATGPQRRAAPRVGTHPPPGRRWRLPAEFRTAGDGLGGGRRNADAGLAPAGGRKPPLTGGRSAR